MDDEVLSCVALTLIPGLGTTRLHQLLHHLESPGQLLRLPAHELARLGISKEARAYITSPYAYAAAQEVVRNAERKGVKVLSIFDAEYPFLLKQIFDPPLVLYCRGRVSDLCQPSIAVVGSRRCSVYGKEVTRKMSRGLSALGLVIVSGLARGIDSEAHIGALEGGGGPRLQCWETGLMSSTRERIESSIAVFAVTDAWSASSPAAPFPHLRTSLFAIGSSAVCAGGHSSRKHRSFPVR